MSYCHVLVPSMGTLELERLRTFQSIDSIDFQAFHQYVIDIASIDMMFIMRAWAILPKRIAAPVHIVLNVCVD